MHIVITPPNAPPTAQEVLKPSAREIYMRFIIRTLGPLKALFWLFNICQTAAIVLPLLPPLSLPPGALTILNCVVLVSSDARPMTAPFFVGASLMTVAGILRWTCYRALGQLFMFNLGVHTNHQLITAGPYSFVCHPSYTTTAMCLLGVLMVHGHLGSWLRDSGVTGNMLVKVTVVTWVASMIISVFILIRRCLAEDELMKRKFGKEWGRMGRESEVPDDTWYLLNLTETNLPFTRIY
ncbi:hypothetical protein SERLADRAFT_369602 [Serpula lacrymans var. lacrymans S7.9]|uniref:Protein-S-isoprenylcysteine O-methyltransferase n=1 Tax=Serpula lacrymans var. lacrymans (strain S7.9) TaxID=578457 RepID=F8NWF8_SERL9|nr:uncharacterized protein SERLADRAFT_369602 [Serpula lacrymans var. lacrymans S7.9]EGO24362.1 hypothetical protein SERLADRAFT_369602 [Serpula lacrymans var. lacrymans S7.9]